MPSYHTFLRAVRSAPNPVLAGITDGAEAMERSQVYLRYEVAERNESWALDHQEVPVWVLPSKGTKPYKPWQTTVMDEATRMVVASVLSPGRPNSETIAAAIAAAVNGFDAPDGTFVGGLPGQVRWDNGADFLSDQLTEAMLRLGVAIAPTSPYSSWENGKLERWHRTIQDELYATMPGFANGPRERNDDQLLRGPDDDLLLDQLLFARALAWIGDYNCTRAHSSLRGRTPLEAWAADDTPLREADEAALRLALLKSDKARTIGKSGIRFRNIDYIHPKLVDLAGRAAELRYLPHDTSFVEVFVADEWVCTAVPQQELGRSGRAKLLRARRSQSEQAKRVLVEAARRRSLGSLAALDMATAEPPAMSSISASDPLDDGIDLALQLADADATSAPTPPDADPDGQVAPLRAVEEAS